MTVHLLKLCVGIDSVEMLRSCQAGRVRRAAGILFTPGFTRRKPRRAVEIAESGSIYWVIRGNILVRQRVLGFADAINSDGQPYCELRLDPALVETAPRRHRPFQGWRYLSQADAPPDCYQTVTPGQMPEDQMPEDQMPAEMAEELRFLGLI